MLSATFLRLNMTEHVNASALCFPTAAWLQKQLLIHEKPLIDPFQLIWCMLLIHMNETMLKWECKIHGTNPLRRTLSHGRENLNNEKTWRTNLVNLIQFMLLCWRKLKRKNFYRSFKWYQVLYPQNPSSGGVVTAMEKGRKNFPEKFLAKLIKFVTNKIKWIFTN